MQEGPPPHRWRRRPTEGLPGNNGSCGTDGGGGEGGRLASAPDPFKAEGVNRLPAFSLSPYIGAEEAVLSPLLAAPRSLSRNQAVFEDPLPRSINVSGGGVGVGECPGSLLRTPTP